MTTSNTRGISTELIRANYNPFAPDYVANPYPIFRSFRAETPICYSPDLHSWLIFSYKEILQALSRPDLFISQNSLRTEADFPWPRVQQLFQGEGFGIGRGTVNSDGQEHHVLRTRLNQLFDRNWLASVEPLVSRILNGLLSDFEQSGDFMRLAYYYPLLIISDALGLPRADVQQVKEWCTQWALLVSGPLLQEDEAYTLALGYKAFQDYASALIAERRRQPRQDMLSELIAAWFPPGHTRSADEERAAEGQLITSCMQLVFAGHETVVGALPNMLLLLLQEPDRWRDLDTSAQGLKDVTDESLRLNGSVLGMFRTTAADVSFVVTSARGEHTVTIPAGSPVQLLYAAANHDPLAFVDPERFDPGRLNASDHLTFGKKAHSCLGAPLYYLESRVLLQRFRKRYPGLRLSNGFAPAYNKGVVNRSLCGLTISLS